MDQEALAAFDSETRAGVRRGARLFQLLTLALLPLLILRDHHRFPAMFGGLLILRLAYVPAVLANLAALASPWAKRHARGASVVLMLPWVVSGVLLTVRVHDGYSHFATVLLAPLMYAMLIPTAPRWVAVAILAVAAVFFGGTAAAGISPGLELQDDIIMFALVSTTAVWTATTQHRLRWQAFHDRWRAERTRAALDMSDRRLQMVTHTAPVLLWLTDRDGATVFANHGWVEFAGQPVEELLSDGWVDMLHPDERASAFATWRAAFEAQRRFTRESRFRRADGEYRWMLTTGVPRFDADGSFAGFAGSAVDVTDQRRAHEDLERFFTLSLDLLAIVGFDGRARRLNPAWERTFGYPIEEMLTRPFHQFIHPDDRAATLEVLGRLRAGVDIVSFENRYRCRDGSYRWMSWCSTAYPGDELIYATARDATTEKEAAIALAESCDRALEGARLKSEFLANMSHEIRTPLNGVMGMAQLALETDLSAEQREYLEVVHTSGDALLALINDILDLSRLEAGRVRLDPVPFDPRAHLAEVLKPLGVRAAKGRTVLRSEVAPGVPATVVGDSGRIRQVLVNLVGNALKFTPAGEVAVQVDVAERRDDRAVLQFTVVDTGIGIAGDQQEAIFETFVQADGSTTRRFGGTGLGLAISRQLVELMGGRISVRSAPGAGSTFSFTVPVRSGVAIPVPAPPRQHARPRGPGVRVLVAEDNPANRLYAVRLLEKHGHTVEAVETGRAALGAVTARSFDVVLMDVQMPDMDGLEATAAIRAREGNVAAHLPIIAVTAHAMKGDRERCLDAGMDVYLAKPVAPDELLATIDRLVYGVPPAGGPATTGPVA